MLLLSSLVATWTVVVFGGSSPRCLASLLVHFDRTFPRYASIKALNTAPCSAVRCSPIIGTMTQGWIGGFSWPQGLDS